jgi:hypothetical protein
MKTNKTRLTIIPGPREFIDGMTSEEIHEVVKYPADEVVDFINNYPNVKALQSGDKTAEGYHNRRWSWQKDDRYFEVTFTLLDESEYYWGGSDIEGSFLSKDIVSFCQSFHERFPASYIHDSDDLSVIPLAQIDDFIQRSKSSENS